MWCGDFLPKGKYDVWKPTANGPKQYYKTTVPAVTCFFWGGEDGIHSILLPFFFPFAHAKQHAPHEGRQNAPVICAGKKLFLSRKDRSDICGGTLGKGTLAPYRGPWVHAVQQRTRRETTALFDGLGHHSVPLASWLRLKHIESTNQPTPRTEVQIPRRRKKGLPLYSNVHA